MTLIQEIITFILFLTFVCGGNVKPLNGQSEVTGMLDQDMTLQWQITFLKDEILQSHDIYLPNRTKIVSNIPPELTPVGKQMYGTRLVPVYDADAAVFKLTLKNVKFTDSSHNFTLVVAFERKDDFNRRTGIAEISIVNVEGGPKLCGDNITAITREEGSMLVAIQDVCGKPTPLVTWKFASEKNFKNSTSFGLINKEIQLYRYTYMHQNLSREQCWEPIIFKAISRLGSVTGRAMVNVTFVPAKVMGGNYYDRDNCTYVTWRRERTGNCRVMYYLQFGNGAKVNTLGTMYKKCNDAALMQVDSVTIWGKYGLKEGEKFTLVKTTPPPPTTTTSTTTTTSKPPIHPEEHSSESSTNIGLIIGVVIGVICFIAIIIIIAVCVLKRRKQKKQDAADGFRMLSPHHSENEYASPVLLDSQQNEDEDPNHALYSKLGPGGGRTGPRPALEHSNYAEIKVDAMGYPVDGAKETASHADYASIDDCMMPPPSDDDDAIIV